jgi:hypothetical protein
MEVPMKHSESLSKLAPALHKAQGAIRGAIKDAKNPFFKSNYADLESCWDAIKGPLQSEGLMVVQTMGFIAGAGPTVITTLLHTSGEYISGEQPTCAKGDNPQELGSAITYARRYGLSAIVGLIQVDDDGQSASKPADSARQDPGAYVIQFGKKLVGQRLDAIDIYELAGFSKWIALLKDPSPAAIETRAAIEAFLKTREKNE